MLRSDRQRSRKRCWVGIALAATLAIAGPAIAGASDPGPHAAGRREVTVSRPNGSTFDAVLHYPATEPGNNTPFDPSGGPYPVVSFGHGYLTPVSYYASTLDHLATHGYFAIASRSGGNLFPSHAAFAADLRYCLDHLIAAGEAPDGHFAGGVASDRLAVSGHSMGGGCAILAAAADSRIDAVLTLAAADTNPSSIAAATGVVAPLRLIVGSADSIVPPGPSAGPMYANAGGPRQLATLVGGSHCGFLDASIPFCDSGSMSRPEQLDRTRALMVEFLDLHLWQDASDWRLVWGPEATGNSLLELEFDPRMSLSPSAQTVEVSASSTASATFTVENTSTAAVEATGSIEPLAGTFDPGAIALPVQGSTAPLTVSVEAAALNGSTVEAVVSVRRPDGARAWATLTVVPVVPTGPDLDGNGIVDGVDLAILLTQFGGAGSADFDGNGIVDGGDLTALLAAWKSRGP